MLTGGNREVLSLAVLAARAVPIAVLTAPLHSSAQPQYEDISEPSSPLVEQPVDLSLPQQRAARRLTGGAVLSASSLSSLNAADSSHHGKPDSYKV